MGKTDYENKLQTAIQHARREPGVPVARYAALYGVNATTLRRRLAGTARDHSTAAREQQLFDVGEERAIADHAGIMADLGFPLNLELLRGIAQQMINDRHMMQQGQGGGITGPKPTTTNPHLRWEKRLQQQGIIASTTTNCHTTPLHVIGNHWVDRFLNCNSGFKKIYIRYQERARAAACNDVELQADFLRKLANLVRRKKISPANIWNCDEKGITMGRNGLRTMAIMHTGGRSTAKMMTEGSREFCSVLETVSATGGILPPFIIWQGKTHRESYYPEGGLINEATFAVSESGYMDDKLGLAYMQEHLSPIPGVIHPPLAASL